MQQPFVSLAGSAVRTVSGNGDTLDLTPYLTLGQTGAPPMLRVQSDVTAASGTTPSLTVVIEDSLDGGMNWNTVGTFTAQTIASRQVQQIAVSGVAQTAGFVWPFNYRKVRARWTITGTTPSFTFSVKAVVL